MENNRNSETGFVLFCRAEIAVERGKIAVEEWKRQKVQEEVLPALDALWPKLVVADDKKNAAAVYAAARYIRQLHRELGYSRGGRVGAASAGS